MSDPWDATVFVYARRLAQQGKEVPAAAFLMLERARQYHMAQITRLERAMTADVLDSEQVVDLAIKRLSAVTEEAPPSDDWRRQRNDALLDVLRQFYRDMDGARDFRYSEAGLTIARKTAAQIELMYAAPSPQRTPVLECLSASSNCRRNNPNAVNCCSLYSQYAAHSPQISTKEK